MAREPLVPTKRRANLAAATMLVVVASVLAIAAVSTTEQPVFDELLAQVSNTAEELSEAKALEAEDMKQSNEDETRVHELASLLDSAVSDLRVDQAQAAKFAAVAKSQQAAVAQLQQQLGLSIAQNGAPQLSNSEEQYTAEQNLLLQQEASLKEQEQQILVQESEENNLATAAESQAQQMRMAASRDEGLLKSEQAAVARNQAKISSLTLQEQPVITEIQNAQNIVNSDRVAMQNAMSAVDEIQEENQATILQAQMDARSKRRRDRDAAEKELNEAVAAEQALQNGPDHRRLKLKGAAAQRLAAAQKRVKDAQAKLSAAYSESYSTPGMSVPTAPSTPALLAAQKKEDAATAKVEADMATLKGKKNKLAMLQEQIDDTQQRMMNNERLMQMIQSRDGSEEANVALITGRAASARQLAAQDAKQVSNLEALAKGVTKRIQYFANMRTSALQRLSSNAMDEKKIEAAQEAKQTQLRTAQAQASILASRAAKAYQKVAQQEKQVAALRAEQQADATRAARFYAAAQQQGRLASAAVSTALQAEQQPIPPPQAPFPTNMPPSFAAK